MSITLKVASSFLSTVDGGHRAIKYTRLGGVLKDIYGEGSKADITFGLMSRAEVIQEPISVFHGSKHP